MPRFVGTGNNSLLNSGGTLDAGLLPKASTTNYGIVQIGAGLSVANGVISVTNNNSGTVTSVALSAPTIFSVTGSPVTSSGTLAVSLVSQASNLVFAGPVSGATPALPTFRSLAEADIPSLDAAKIGSGTVASARLPVATASVAGVIKVGTGLTISSGVLNADLDLNNTTTTVAANRVLAGPSSGSNAIAAFRALTGSDLPVATASTLGAIKVGTGLTISNGILNADLDLNNTTTVVTANFVLAGPASGTSAVATFRGLTGADLPVATTLTLGAVKVGSGLSISNAGVLSADVDLNNTTTTVPAAQILAGPVSGSSAIAAFRGLVGTDLPVATASTLGAVKIGSGLSITDGVLSSDLDLTATTTTVAPNLILAGPSAGAVDATPTFRVLAVADVPNLPASKITSGTVDSNLLPVATDTVAGVVKIGAGLSMADGILSVTGTPSGGGGGGASGGSVTSVGLSAPANIFNIAGSPVTTSGTLALTLDNQDANMVFAGPAGGSAAEPGFRSLASADIPALSTDKLTSGTLPVARGGTGLNALGSSNQVLKVNSAGSALVFGKSVELSSNRQCVLSGPVSSDNLPNFLNFSDLSVGYSGATTPIVLAFANGFSSGGAVDYIETLSTTTANTWTLPINSTSYLYAERVSEGNVTFGSTTLEPWYSHATPVTKVSQIVIEVYDYTNYRPLAGYNNGAVINELTITDQNGATVAYTVSSTEAWDTTQNGVPLYWNSAQYYMKSNLNDGQTAAGTGAQEEQNSVLLLWTAAEGPNTGKWARFLVTLTSVTDVSTVNVSVNVGGYAGRIPVSVSAYLVSSTYNKANHLQSRTNTGLTLMGTVAPSATTTPTNFTVCSNINIESPPTEGQFRFNVSRMYMEQYTSGAWTTKPVLFLGEATTGASAVTSLTPYAYNGIYTSSRFAVSSNTIYTKNHNIGCYPNIVWHTVYSSSTATTGNNPVFYFVGGTGNQLRGSSISDVTKLSYKVVVQQGGAVYANPSSTGSVLGGSGAHVVMGASRGW